ncbi:MAG: CDP-alcohol phosphatidyltransferase family protein [Opitutales bacterium]
MKDKEELWQNVHQAGKIYLLPNFFTAGNLFFGFSSMVLCIMARYNAVDDSAMHKFCKMLFPATQDVSTSYFLLALLCIILAVFSDIFDGRVARATGKSSMFGMQFDSIADTVSFGVAPALLTMLLILNPLDELPQFMQGYMGSIGFFVSFIYLLCACVRLSRFNVLTCPYIKGHEKYSKGDFVGLPAPAAAGVVVSISLTMLSSNLGTYSICLVPLVLLTSWFMISGIPYPTFKYINWDVNAKLRTFIFIIACVIMALYFKEYSFSILFIAYAFYSPIKYLPRFFKVVKYIKAKRLRTKKAKKA